MTPFICVLLICLAFLGMLICAIFLHHAISLSPCPREMIRQRDLLAALSTAGFVLGFFLLFSVVYVTR